MKVKAKFVVTGEEKFENYTNKTVYLSSVTTGSEENKSFAKYTPSGQLSICIDESTEAYSFFESGKEYYLTFEAAE